MTSQARSGVRIGIHCQDDTGCAVANTIAAVEAGATHVQGTANGYGERTGNADIFSVVANLELKLGMPVLPPGSLTDTVRVSHAIAEIANLATRHPPAVRRTVVVRPQGRTARQRAEGVGQELYNHIDPELVGNDMRILVTEMAGRASVELKSRELGLTCPTTRRPSRGVVATGSRTWSRRAGRSRLPTLRSS